MKTPIRFQSRLLLRRSYKPVRKRRRNLGVAFRSAPRFAVKVAEQKAVDTPAADNAETFAYSI
jgi:hypothetical protein